MRGAGIDELENFGTRIEAAWDGRPSGFDNAPAEARYLHMKGRLKTAAAAIIWAEGHRPGAADTCLDGHEGTLREAQENLHAAYLQGHNVLRSRLEREEIRYDLALANVLLGQVTGEDIIEYHNSLYGKVGQAGSRIPPYVDPICGRAMGVLGRKLVIIGTSRPTGTAKHWQYSAC